MRTAPGVACVLTAADVPGHNDVSPAHRGDDPIFADGLVEYYGQPLFAVAADSLRAGARRGRARDGRVRDLLEPVLDVDQARQAGSYVTEAHA